MKREMKKYYFTFCCGIGDARRNCYHVEVAESHGKAREQMIAKFGTDWASQYTEEEWQVSKMDYRRYLSVGRCLKQWHQGFTQADMFNLREI